MADRPASKLNEPHKTPVPGAPSTESPTTSLQFDQDRSTPTATIDPNKPSWESAPTALPTNPTTHPAEQKEAVKNEHPAVVRREVEKTKAEERDLKGENPLGTVVHGLEDDRLWAMLRRFDVASQITHVLHPAKGLPPREPDLRPTTLPNLPSHADVLRSNMERCIAAVGPSSLRGARELQRLMSWAPEERLRTGSYCVAYFIAWFFGYAVAAMCFFFATLVCFPSTRRWLFPPVAPAPFTPPSATDPTNQKGDESLLGNVDGKTVHRSKAEQAEEQAFEGVSILKAYTTRLLWDGSKEGKAAGNANVGEKNEESSLSSSDFNEEDKPQGEDSAEVIVGGEKIVPSKPMSEKERKQLAQTEAKRKRDQMVSKMTKATEDGLGAFADMAERMINALSPPSPYPDSFARFKIATAFIVPPAFLLTFVPAWVFGRAATFMFGVGMWGQPLLIEGAHKFKELVPNWQEFLDIRNSILSRVPTDAQLTLHLLRVTEALGKPLPRPPPPPLKGTPKEAIKDTTPATVTAEDDAEVLEAEEKGKTAEATMAKVKHKTKSHITNVFKSAGKHMAGFRGDVSVDGARKQIGDTVDQVLFRGLIRDNGSIDSYPAKLDGTSGRIILNTPKDRVSIPTISFVPTSSKTAYFVRPIDDIVEIKKSHVSMPRMALGWASGADIEGLGLTVRFKSGEQQARDLAAGPGVKKEDGDTLHFKRVARREGLFARLVSMGRQRWATL
nr:hypothetical protein L203_05347 [Cryptococcus depauperatus CBS 7841]